MGSPELSKQLREWEVETEEGSWYHCLQLLSAKISLRNRSMWFVVAELRLHV